MSNYTGHLKASISAAGAGSSVWGWLQNLRAALHRSHERRVAIRELSALSDRQLADIGIIRSQIPEVVQTLSAHKAVNQRVAEERVVSARLGSGYCVGHS